MECEQNKELVQRIAKDMEPYRQEMSRLCYEDFHRWELTDHQKDDLGRQFCKWINEGMGDDYYPDCRRYPYFLNFIIDDNSGHGNDIETIFGPKGVEFE